MRDVRNPKNMFRRKALPWSVCARCCFGAFVGLHYRVIKYIVKACLFWPRIYYSNDVAPWYIWSWQCFWRICMLTSCTYRDTHILYGPSLVWVKYIQSLQGSPFDRSASLSSRKSLKLAAKYIAVLYQMHSPFVQLICTVCKAILVLKRKDPTFR